MSLDPNPTLEERSLCEWTALGSNSPETLPLVRFWLEAAKINEGHIFRRVSGNQIGARPLHPYSVNRILKLRARAAGLSAAAIAQLSGDSMRAGAAHDLILAGLNVLAIMQAGGWKTINVVGRYVENANLATLLRKTREGAASILPITPCDDHRVEHGRSMPPCETRSPLTKPPNEEMP